MLLAEKDVVIEFAMTLSEFLLCDCNTQSAYLIASRTPPCLLGFLSLPEVSNGPQGSQGPEGPEGPEGLELSLQSVYLHKMVF